MAPFFAHEQSNIAEEVNKLLEGLDKVISFKNKDDGDEALSALNQAKADLTIVKNVITSGASALPENMKQNQEQEKDAQKITDIIQGAKQTLLKATKQTPLVEKEAEKEEQSTHHSFK